jgi:hypothetical protein
MLKRLTWRCGNCGCPVTQETKVCPSCGAHIDGILTTPEAKEYLSIVNRKTPRLRDCVWAIIAMIIAFFPIWLIFNFVVSVYAPGFFNSLPYHSELSIIGPLIIDTLFGVYVAYYCLYSTIA